MATLTLRKAVLGNVHMRRICSAPTNTTGPSFLRNPAIYSLTSASLSVQAGVSTRSLSTFGDGMAGRKTVVVDGLNYLLFFVQIKEPENESKHLGHGSYMKFRGSAQMHSS